MPCSTIRPVLQRAVADDRAAVEDEEVAAIAKGVADKTKAGDPAATAPPSALSSTAVNGKNQALIRRASRKARRWSPAAWPA
jgi:hypothetical protein